MIGKLIAGTVARRNAEPGDLYPIRHSVAANRRPNLPNSGIAASYTYALAFMSPAVAAIVSSAG
jgi:hypothetical protein